MDWINATTDNNLAKVEDTASGAVACQILDLMYPGQVPMHKVNWAAKQNFEFVANYKILQTCFTKLKIDRHIDVDRLISGRYMDNLEFMQWFKRYFELSGTVKGDYDAVAQRAKGKGADEKPKSAVAKATITGGSAVPAPKAAPASAPVVAKKETAKPVAAAKPLKENNRPEPTPSSSSSSVATTMKSVAKGTATAPAAPHSSDVVALKLALKQANESADKSLSELRTEMDGLEKERDFYFDKLRDIEILLQECEDSGNKSELTESIFKILYATAEGFEQSALESSKNTAAALELQTLDTEATMSFPHESVEETF